jgi:excinuclease ABC subunit C
VARTINTLQRAFLLRSCSDAVYESRTRPCLLYQIKRCSAPCTGEIALDDYARLVDEASRFLKGESQEVRKRLQAMMSEAADRLEFERAAALRNRLQAMSHVTADQTINPEGIEEADVFAAYQDGGQTCIQVFFFRAGQNWGNRAYFPRADKSLDVGEILASFIAQFYDDKPVPRLILLSHDVAERELLAEALSTRADRRVEITVPQRGAKTGLIEHALANAREALGRKLAESSSQRHLLAGIAERFGLPAPPRRIEVFDNSHIAGTNAVGAMIVAGAEGFIKNQYRKFNIRSEDLTPGDDYAMMREVLTRRFKRLQMGAEQEQPSPPLDAEAGPEPELSSPLQATDTDDMTLPRSRLQSPTPPSLLERGADAIAFGVLPADTTAPLPDEDADMPDLAAEPLPDRPDLVLIDGGAGQLGVAQAVMAELGVHDICVIGVAKGPDRDAGREHFHIPGRDKPVMLEPRDPVLYFVQRLRDEAHRFAIGTHRARRSKSIGANPLDEIAGIGPTRRRALLKHFGSAKAVSRASPEDLRIVDGISREMAQRIYDFFHEREA